MKNANSRFVRVLAIVLVVLMVVPAALVGCGSNKATNDAISEALAAAEAAKQEAEAAKQAAAEAAKKDEEEKAALQEAIDKALAAAEAAKKELEALKGTTVPGVTTSPVSQDDKIVADYAFQMLKEDSELAKIFAPFYYELDAAGDIVLGTDDKPVLNTKVYATDDLAEMFDLFEKVKLTIQRATTVDYINTLVANFKADLDAVPTYAERVKALYAAIDFESDFDVVDVVKAAKFLDGAHEDVREELEEEGLVTEIYTEFYRYTGADANIAEYIDTELVTAEDVLYKALFDGAVAVYDAVIALLGEPVDGKLSVKNIAYGPNMNDKLDAADLAFETWEEIFENSDAVDAAAVDYLADFRKAFVGVDMPFIFEEGDHLWETYLAAGERVAQLEAAAEAYADLADDYYDDLSAIGTEEFDYADSVKLLADAKAAFDAWMAEYDFDDEDPNVDTIVGVKDVIDVYEEKVRIAEYFTFLKAEIEKVNADAFLAAFEQVEASRKIDSFDFAKYGEAVKKAIKWYVDFKAIVPSAENKFTDLDAAEFAVAALLTDVNYKETLAEFLEARFTDDEDIDALFATMEDVYTVLADAKEAADLINAEIYKLTKKATLNSSDYNTFKAIIGANYPQYVADKDAENLAGAIAAWFEEYADTFNMEFDDVNFKAMIDWKALDSVYNAYEANLIDAKEAARKIALLYIAWKGEPTTVKKVAGITYDGNFFAGLEELNIDVYSYELVKELLPFDVASFAGEDGKGFDVDLAVNEKTVINLSVNTIETWKNEMVNAFYNEMKAVSTAVADGASALFNGAALYGKDAALRVGTDYRMTEITLADNILDNIAKNSGLKIATDAEKALTKYADLKDAIKTFLEDNDFNYNSIKKYTVGSSTYGFWEAVYSVNVSAYINTVDVLDSTTSNETDKTKAFSSLKEKEYKAAINAAVADMYAKWYAEYIKDGSAATNLLNSITADVNQITELVLNKGLWAVNGEFELDGDTYAYAFNYTNNAYDIVVKDADGDVCVDEKLAKQTVDADNYVIPTLTYTVANGVITIAPNFDARTGTVTDEQVKKLIGFGAEEYKSTTLAEIVESLTVKHDIRDAVDAIAANFAKIAGITKQNNTSAKYTVLSADLLNGLFNAEAVNKFYAKRVELITVMFDTALINSSNGTQAAVGSYINGALSDEAKAAVDAVAFQYYYGSGSVVGFKNLPDTTPIEDMDAYFAAFKSAVNFQLASYGYEFTTNAAGTQITIIVEE